MTHPVGSSVGLGRLRGKKALVTGAARGIGLGIAALFSREGAAVACVDRDRPALDAIKSEFESPDQKIIFLVGDATSEQSVNAFVEQAASELGGLDIVVNNAALTGRGSIETTSEADWDRISLNTKTIYLVSRSALSHLRKSAGPAIVNIGSGAGVRGFRGAAAYGTAKSGVLALTRLMALDHGPEGIRVNCVCPGLTETDNSRAYAEAEARQRNISIEDVKRQSARLYPLGRIGTPLDIASAVLFLSSDEASWITGATLVVDGGRCAGAD